MAETQANSKPRYPQSFHMDEDGNQLVLETIGLGSYSKKSAMFRDAVKQLNKLLKERKA